MSIGRPTNAIFSGFAVGIGLVGASLAGCSAIDSGLCKIMPCDKDPIIYEPVNPDRPAPSDEAVLEGLRKARQAEVARQANGN